MSGRSLGGGNGYPLQYSCLENPMDRGAWWATAHGVTKVWDTTERLCTTQTWKTTSQLDQRNCSEKGREESECKCIVQKNPGSQTIRRLSEIKEHQKAHVNEFRAFLSLGRRDSLGSLKSSLWAAPGLFRARTLFFSILCSLRVQLCFNPEFLRAHQPEREVGVQEPCSWLGGLSILCQSTWQITFFLHGIKCFQSYI